MRRFCHGFSHGLGFGGFGAPWCPCSYWGRKTPFGYELSKEEEKAFLEDLKKDIEEELEDIKKRLEELK